MQAEVGKQATLTLLPAMPPPQYEPTGQGEQVTAPGAAYSPGLQEKRSAEGKGEGVSVVDTVVEGERRVMVGGTVGVMLRVAEVL